MADWGYGTTFEMGDGTCLAPGSYGNIAEVKSISGPKLEADTVDVTNFDSTNGYEEIIPTLLRSGEVSLELNFDPADDTHDSTSGLISKWAARYLTPFKITFSDDPVAGTEWEFCAYVTSFEPSVSVDEANSASVTLKISGEVTFGA